MKNSIFIIALFLQGSLYAQIHKRRIVECSIQAIPFMVMKRIAVTEASLPKQRDYLRITIPTTDSLKDILKVASKGIVIDSIRPNRYDIRLLVSIKYSDSSIDRLVIYSTMRYMLNKKLYNAQDCVLKYFLSLLPKRYGLSKPFNIKCPTAPLHSSVQPLWPFYDLASGYPEDGI
jgi:hypothetical protein